ncbi:MAG: bifunctional response regulator/alkaline phosphatase family protein [Candidatus Eisenbacteria bacterium]|nr:bifunctional response regulator/alkaline phosphatase family protein [Candidatus Eisenbacteria bacterium]
MEPSQRKILWADDEIDLLRPHVLYLEGKGYAVATVSNGEDALALASDDAFDVILLDEQMPGMGGLKTLEALRDVAPQVPVIMITKSEEEHLMNEALGRQIADYLTKPVNPSQIWLACKKVFESERLVRDRRTRNYVTEFNRILQLRQGDLGWEDWLELASRISSLDLELSDTDESLYQSHQDEKAAINREFARFVELHYSRWTRLAPDQRPPLSIDVFPRYVLPHLREKRQVVFIVIDCMRLDQWLALEPLLAPYFQIKRDLYFSVLPTATPYSRNAIFSGLFPLQIARTYPEWWLENVGTETGKNRFERALLRKMMEREKIKLDRLRYLKVHSAEDAAALKERILSQMTADMLAVVINFLDLLSHGRSENELLLELAPHEQAFRSLLISWFTHSSLFEMLKLYARKDVAVILTTDHGSVQCKKSSLVYGNRETSTNVRYKFGDNLVCDEKEALHIKRPQDYMLPMDTLTKNYILARENYYFVYPTNFHQYERHFKGSFQHGGISIEEMILPVATMIPRTI